MGKDSSLMQVGKDTKVTALASRILDQVRRSGYVTLGHGSQPALHLSVIDISGTADWL
jgi:hypothetical protein